MNNKRNYIHDGVFDKFDLKEFLLKEIYIKPTSKEKFLYSSEIETKKEEKKESEEEVFEDPITQINKNHFGIDLNNLFIKYKSSYTMKFTECFLPIKLIGQGSFGLVISVKHIETDKIYAVKIIKKQAFHNRSIPNEVEMLRHFDNKRIMKLYDVVDTNDFLFLIAELIEGGSLKDFIIERFLKCQKGEIDYFITDTECSIIVKGILEGIDSMHQNSIMHRDLKPDNIMFRSKNDLSSVIIADFGIAGGIVPGLFENYRCGTLIYMAPEMIAERPYDQYIDLWACGIIMYILESGGLHPIYLPGMDRKDYIRAINSLKDWSFPESFPNLARNLFLKICKVEPFYRYRTNKSLQHPWITRDINSVIPLTLIDSYEKDFKIKQFKTMLACSIYFNIFKSMNTEMFMVKPQLKPTKSSLVIFSSDYHKRMRKGVLNKNTNFPTVEQKTGKVSSIDVLKTRIHKRNFSSGCETLEKGSYIILPKIRKLNFQKGFNNISSKNNASSSNNSYFVCEKKNTDSGKKTNQKSKYSRAVLKDRFYQSNSVQISNNRNVNFRKMSRFSIESFQKK